MSVPRVSVLIVSWNTRALTLACLDALPAAAGPVTYETIVVDNASVDGSAEALAARADIDLVANAENRGYAEAVNQAYRRSRGELLLLLNSDVTFAPGQLAQLVDFLDRTPQAAGVAPLYRNPDGSAQSFHYELPTYAQVLATGSTLLRRLPTFARAAQRHAVDAEPIAVPRPVPQPSASCLLLRRSCFGPGRVLDERYPIFFNDVQLARTLAQHGHELWVTPAVTVTHEGHASTSQGGGLKRQYIGSVVRLLQETEPAHRVLAYRALVLGQGLSLRLLRRPGSLSLGDLWAAAGGDTGPLPAAPAARRR